MQALDITKDSVEGQALLSTFTSKLVGQQAGAETLINLVAKYRAGLSTPRRPAGVALFLGPTRSGKTYTVELLCEALFGDARACIKIDCAEYQHGHEIAKLVGSPPGYLGHRETHPLFTQQNLNVWHTDKLKLSVILFDEIEKASDTLWNLLLGILDKAECTTGTNERVDFSQTLIIMASNVGAKELAELAGNRIGFAADNAVIESEIANTAINAAKRKFSPEFFNRLDNIVVYRSLSEADIRKIMYIELGKVQQRFLRGNEGILFSLDEAAREKLLSCTKDNKAYNVGPLLREIEKMLVTPLAKLIASGQLKDRDIVRVKYEGGDTFKFYKTTATGAGK